MKLKYLSAILWLVFVAACTSSDGAGTEIPPDGEIAITRLQFDSHQQVLGLGSTFEPVVRVMYEGAGASVVYDLIENKDDLFLQSSAPEVVSVRSGVLHALSEGKATVKVETFDGTCSDEMTVEVRKEIAEVRLSSFGVVAVSECLSLGVEVRYEGGTLWSAYDMSKNPLGLSFEIADSDIASIDDNGALTGIKAGITSVKVASVDGEFSDERTVYVINRIEGIRFKQQTLGLSVGETVTAELEVCCSEDVWTDYDCVKNPDSLRYSSFDLSIVTFSEGKITAVGTGNAMIIARSRDGARSATASVRVMRAVEKIVIRTDSVVCGSEAILSLGVVYKDEPERVYDYDTKGNPAGLKFFTADGNIISASALGVLKGMQEGVAEITVSVPDSEVSASKRIVCSKKIAEVMFTGKRYFVDVGGKSSLGIQVRYENETFAQVYDAVRNSGGLVFASGDENVAKVDAAGTVTGVAKGLTVLSAATADGKVRAEVDVYTSRTINPRVFEMPLSRDLLYSNNARLPKNALMQCFDIDSKGDIYYVQLANADRHNLHVSKGSPNAAYTTSMTLSYFGHGTNFAIEEDGDDTYIWMSSYASRNDAGQYWSGQTVARVKFRNGVTLKPEDCTDHYYVGMYESHAAVDEENDLLMIMSSQGTGHAYCKIYSLAEAKSVPLSTVQLMNRNWGGATSSEPSQSGSQRVQVHDLRKIKPVADVAIKFADFGANVENPNQGFEVGPNRIYNWEGSGRGNGTDPSTAKITVFDFSGNLVCGPLPVMAIEDINGLKELGIASTGYMEAEGMKVIGDKLYLGFGQIIDGKSRSCVFQYPF